MHPLFQLLLVIRYTNVLEKKVFVIIILIYTLISFMYNILIYLILFCIL